MVSPFSVRVLAWPPAWPSGLPRGPGFREPERGRLGEDPTVIAVKVAGFLVKSYSNFIGRTCIEINGGRIQVPLSADQAKVHREVIAGE